jgi:hypothetical protein
MPPEIALSTSGLTESGSSPASARSRSKRPSRGLPSGSTSSARQSYSERIVAELSGKLRSGTSPKNGSV